MSGLVFYQCVAEAITPGVTVVGYKQKNEPRNGLFVKLWISDCLKDGLIVKKTAWVEYRNMQKTKKSRRKSSLLLEDYYYYYFWHWKKAWYVRQIKYLWDPQASTFIMCRSEKCSGAEAKIITFYTFVILILNIKMFDTVMGTSVRVLLNPSDECIEIVLLYYLFY